MITIKLRRIGKKKKPFYNVIAMEKTFHIKGKYIEKLGYFDPFNKKEKTFLKIEKINKWITKGAVLSKRAKSLIKYYMKNIILAKRKKNDI